MAAAMTVKTQRHDGGRVELAAVGELDLSTISRFESALAAAVAEAAPGRSTELDLRGVDYLDSAAINVLFTHAERLSVVRVPPLLLRALTISGLDQIVEVVSTPSV
jgi:anti-anti-sigma factor